MGEVRIAEARWPDDRDVVESLFREYVASLAEDISFQNVDDELSTLPGKYVRPGGLVLIAWLGDDAAGAVAYRMVEPGVCEMKRLYVRPAFRGTGIARDLANELIAQARRAGYRVMLLDTLEFDGGRAGTVSRARLRAGGAVLRQSAARRDVHGAGSQRIGRCSLGGRAGNIDVGYVLVTHGTLDQPPVAAEASMIAVIRNGIAVVMGGVFFGLVLAKPFLPADIRPVIMPLATVLGGAGFALILLMNKLLVGAFLPGRPVQSGNDGEVSVPSRPPVSRVRLRAGLMIMGFVMIYGLVKLYVFGKSAGML